ncbi:MAG: hypothetical protein NT162_02330 [Candidatus Woesebacteria bacterium]|nr:hypothetical protein [Candidatus Woesebacteria bacterium]
MENIKQYLTEKVKKQIENTKEEIKKSDEEIEKTEIDNKVDRKILEMLDVDAHLDTESKEDVKYTLEAAEGMLLQEKERNANLKRDLKILEYKLKVIESQF